jgi:hypothetical protein
MVCRSSQQPLKIRTTTADLFLESLDRLTCLSNLRTLDRKISWVYSNGALSAAVAVIALKHSVANGGTVMEILCGRP